MQATTLTDPWSCCQATCWTTSCACWPPCQEAAPSASPPAACAAPSTAATPGWCCGRDAAAPPPPWEMQLALSHPRLRSLTAGGTAEHSPWAQLYRDGRRLQHLEQLTFWHCSVQKPFSLFDPSKLQHLALQYCLTLTSLQGLASCVGLQHLDLKGCVGVRDLAPLASCTQLQYLDLGRCLFSPKVEDLIPLASCVKLQHLDLKGCKVADLTPLTPCTELRHLDLRWCEDVVDIGPLAAFVKLQHLDIWGCYVDDTSPLAALSSLQHLGLAHDDDGRDDEEYISYHYGGPLQSPSLRLPSLTSLNLGGEEHYMEDLQPLAHCPQLESLELRVWRQRIDLTRLAAHTRLRCLVISSIKVHDLGPLAACAELRHVKLSTIAEHLGPLAACVKLTCLELPESEKVEDISALASCVDLHSLHLSDCTRLHDLSPLSACTRLQYLDVSRSRQIQDFAPLAACVALCYLRIHYDYKSDFNCLYSLAALPHLAVRYDD